MEMERINDDLIKVFIDVHDLEERGVNFLDLISDQRSVEKFFYSILEEVDVDRQFYDSEAITFQVIPSSDGIELYISRSNFDDMDQLLGDEIMQRLRDRKKQIEKAQKDHQTEENKVSKVDVTDSEEVSLEDERYSIESIIRFENLESFLVFARDNRENQLEGDLYRMNNMYYFAVEDAFLIEEGSDDYYTVMSMLDYGEPSYTTPAVLEEYGELVRSYDAISYFGKHF